MKRHSASGDSRVNRREMEYRTPSLYRGWSCRPRS